MNPTKNPISKKHNIRIIFRRKYLMQVTLAETHVALLSSTKDVVKVESMKEDSIVPIFEGL